MAREADETGAYNASLHEIGEAAPSSGVMSFEGDVLKLAPTPSGDRLTIRERCEGNGPRE